MARGINKVILVGNLGSKPELKHFSNGGCVCNVSLATSDSWQDKQTGMKREQTEWHKLVFNDSKAEVIAKYTDKGTQLYIEGRLKTRTYKNQQNIDVKITEIKVMNFEFLSNGSTRNPSGGFNAPATNSDCNSSTNDYVAAVPVDLSSNWDDDIPF